MTRPVVLVGGLDGVKVAGVSAHEDVVSGEHRSAEHAALVTLLLDHAQPTGDAHLLAARLVALAGALERQDDEPAG